MFLMCKYIRFNQRHKLKNWKISILSEKEEGNQKDIEKDIMNLDAIVGKVF